MQLTEAIDQREVTIAIETAHLLCTKGYEVVVIDVAQRCCSVAIHRHRVSIEVITTLGDVTTGKEGIVDGDAAAVELIPFLETRCLICALILVSVLKLVQSLQGHIFTFSIRGLDTRCRIGSKAADTAFSSDLAVRLNGDVTIACQSTVRFELILIVNCFCHRIDVIEAATIGRNTLCQVFVASVGTGLRSCGTIDIALVTTAEHVAVAQQHTGLGADLATTDMYVGRAEDITLRTAVHVVLFLLTLEIAFTVPVVIASTTAENVAHHMAAPQIDMGFTSLVDGCRLTTFKTIIVLDIRCVIEDRSNRW